MYIIFKVFKRHFYLVHKNKYLSRRNLKHFGEVKFSYKISENGSPQQFRFVQLYSPPVSNIISYILKHSIDRCTFSRTYFIRFLFVWFRHDFRKVDWGWMKLHKIISFLQKNSLSVTPLMRNSIETYLKIV